MTQIDAKLAKLATERVTIEARIQPDLDRLAEINLELEEALADHVGTHPVPGTQLAVKVTRGSSFKPARFAVAHPVTDPANAKFYAAVPVLERIKRHLSPEDLAAYYDQNKPSIKVV